MTTKTTRKKKAAFQRNTRNKTAMILVTVVVAMVMLVVGVRCAGLSKQKKEYDAKAAQYEKLIAEQEARAEELKEFEKYTQTSMYIEEIAKSKFGLVHDGEIVFIAEK